jgi:hypothetical protein
MLGHRNYEHDREHANYGHGHMVANQWPDNGNDYLNIGSADFHNRINHLGHISFSVVHCQRTLYSLNRPDGYCGG